MGFDTLGHLIHDYAVAAASAFPESYRAAAEWIATAAMDGVFGLALGLVLIPVGEKVISPIWNAMFGGKKEAGHAG